MFGYFTIVGIILGFFLSTLILMTLWGGNAPSSDIENNGLPHGNTYNFHALAGYDPTNSSRWMESKNLIRLSNWR
ncbi:hypothetical protein ACFLTP_09340 [Chloroflexota bacterium]